MWRFFWGLFWGALDFCSSKFDDFRSDFAFLLKMSENQAAFLKSSFFDLQICVIPQKKLRKIVIEFWNNIWGFFVTIIWNFFFFFRFSIPKLFWFMWFAVYLLKSLGRNSKKTLLGLRWDKNWNCQALFASAAMRAALPDPLQ